MNKLVLGIMLLAMLVAFSAPAMAAECWDDVKTRQVGFTPTGFINGTITNGAVIALGGGSGNGPWTVTLPPGTVKMAYVHWHSWGNGGTPNHQLRFESGTGAVETIDITDCVFDDSVSGAWASGFSPANGTTHGFWKVNASEGSNTFTILLSGDVYNKWFVAVIDETDVDNRTHQGHWWHNFGFQDPNFGVNYSTWFYNANSDPINTDADYTLWTAQSHANKFTMYFNDLFVDNRSTPGCYDSTFEEFNVDNIDSDGSQKATWKDVVDQCAQYMYVYSATLAEAIPLGESKLDPIDIEFPKMMRPNTGYTINATIKNTGDAASGAGETATLYVNGVENGTEIIPVLEPGATSEPPVSFTNVNLPEGCYEFKVVVTSCSNELVEYYQVGYVIVVESDSDFADLVNDSEMPSGSVTYDGDTGTYYIQNLTITNCAGDGISIEGTTKNFVIKNCTVENCTGGSSGVFLNNVTKGTITGCTLHNNKDYGIELGLVPLDSTDPKNINITCNTIYQNGISTDKNGIDLIGYNCIVRDNTVRDNGEYGIYVHGNENKICNNIIEDNDNYGVKLYNSSGNYVYWNNFTNNNGVGVQGHDGWFGLPGLDLNTWNSPKCGGYPYGTVYTNYTGNYWDDHTASDTDGDGIVDTAYPIDGGAGAEDPYPLVTLPWRVNITIYSGKNLIGVPLFQDDPTLDAIFGSNNPVQSDKVRKFDAVTQQYITSMYFGGTTGWYNSEDVEPIDPTAGYEYERQSTNFTLVLVGTRLCPSWVFTPIWPGKNLIGYLNFTPTTLAATFGDNNPIQSDKVRRYNNSCDPCDGSYITSMYVGGTTWYPPPPGGVEPIVASHDPDEHGGYEYERNGALFWWIYEA